jgi:3-oxoacyl-[acyl-carrier-protein] synthase III
MSEVRTGIAYSDYYLPSRFMGIKEFFQSIPNFKLPEGNNDIDSYCESYHKRRKIKGIYIEEERNESEVFELLLGRFFETSGIAPKDIDILIYTKGVPIHFNAINIPYYMQKKFGIKNAMTFNVDQTCGASLMAIHIADTLIKSGRYKSALILSSSFMKSLESRNVQLTLIGDGAGILYLNNKDNKVVIRDFLSRTTGSLEFSIESFTKRENYRELMMYLQDGADTINELVRRNKTSLDAIKLISPQNTNYLGWEIYTTLLGIKMDKIFLENISQGAHIGDVDTIRNITDITRKKILQPGETMIAYGIGWGTSWNALLLDHVI